MRRRVPREVRKESIKKRISRGNKTPLQTPRMKSIDKLITETSLQKRAADMKTRGFTYQMIAEELDVNLSTAKSYVSRGLEEYLADRDEVVHRLFATTLSLYDQTKRIYGPLAFGYEIKNRRTGKVRKVEPDPEAMHIILRAQRDLNTFISHGQPQRMELSGIQGGPIMTAAVDAMEAARLVRASFGENASKTPSPVPADADPSVQH